MNVQSTISRRDPIFVDPRMLVENPHAMFAELRDSHPLIRLGDGHFMALRANDVLAMLTDPRTKQVEGADYVRLQGVPDGATRRFLADFFLFANGAEHRAKRGLFARAFAFARMRDARPQVRSIADEIVNTLPRGEGFDFIDLMAARVPAEMTAGLLGLPRSDATYFAPLVYALSQAIRPIYPQEIHDQTERATQDLFNYVAEHLRARMRSPQDDLLSTLVTDWQTYEVISFDSLVHQVLGVIVGGTDTTRAGFASMVALLLKHPEAWDAAKDCSTLIPGAVSEALRYEPSVGSIARFTTETVDIGGYELPPGMFLRVSTMSAMRDPELYWEPERFDILRTDHPRLHCVFGLGPHRCLGEMLARIEMEEGLAALVASAPDIELLMAPKMTGFGGIRQISPMVVQIN